MEKITRAEYDAISEATSRATATFRKAQDAYRAMKIGDDEYLDARGAHDKAIAAWDIAYMRATHAGIIEPVEPEVEAVGTQAVLF